MIVLETQEMEDYLREVEEFAKSIGMAEQFQEQYDYLDTYAGHGDYGQVRCRLMKDFAPHSFYFVMEVRKEETEVWKTWFEGGLIYHGEHDRGGDGGPPTFSVNLVPKYGWSVHT